MALPVGFAARAGVCVYICTRSSTITVAIFDGRGKSESCGGGMKRCTEQNEPPAKFQPRQQRRYDNTGRTEIQASPANRR